MSIWLSISMVCAIIFCAVFVYVARYILLVCMASGLWATHALALSYTSSTLGALPNETKAVCLAFVSAMGNLAQIYGAYLLFPSTDAPIMGFSVISMMMCTFGVVVYAMIHILLRRYPIKNEWAWILISMDFNHNHDSVGGCEGSSASALAHSAWRSDFKVDIGQQVRSPHLLIREIISLRCTGSCTHRPADRY